MDILFILLLSLLVLAKICDLVMRIRLKRKHKRVMTEINKTLETLEKLNRRQ